MFVKIGFFHFGKKHAEPFDELRKELEKAQQCKGPLAGSLIVLPEGFNVRKLYTDTTRRCQFYPEDPLCLQGIAKEFGVAFVVDLILKQQCGGTPKRYSSAYFIDGSSQVLMCQKSCKDGFEGKDIRDDDTEHNYTACEVGSCDKRNPYDGVGIKIGALICADVNCPKTQEVPDQCYWKRVLRIAKDSDVICIPAHMMDKGVLNIECDENGNRRVALTSDSKILILANSRPDGISSLITDSASIIRGSSCGPENEVVTLPLDSLTVGR